MFVNTLPVINITEGETVTVVTGLDPEVSVGARVQLAKVLSEDGSAIGKKKKNN